ncbi:hypothetical protein DICPUDRAFT_32017 [Dictyostelium purpureum]|uniref:Oligopeptide transporter n=1 Tax=Dictyostelium purpureum TaxID=5786 RepID=F0ZI58_DICPU|nr:uncharacterized protein DICPUDRAFT_32017 [Dictyostelium purpureum]EGC36348.1 hypothetical protein DICPUDRAFT_32017 [Dictyostelium purpureum]|eukprot:XP_003287102.1 hypothetical protein DICPUDRAFT_32017 [Dictyostelium purpureum]
MYRNNDNNNIMNSNNFSSHSDNITSPTDSSNKYDDVNIGIKDGDNASILKQITLRSVIAGTLIGGIMCFSNMYFGLQTGWVTMGSLQSTLLGFLFFKLIEKHLKVRFNHFENVLLQTIAVATATMPLAGGFVGIIPALNTLFKDENGSGESLEKPSYFSWWGLILWAFSLAFFGVFFAVPLRRQTILVEKLKFPSGSATAQMIRVLHKLKNSEVHQEMLSQEYETTGLVRGEESDDREGTEFLDLNSREIDDDDDEGNNNDDHGFSYERNEKQRKIADEWNKKVKVLSYSFLASFTYTLASYFFPILQSIPIFGDYVKTTFFWSLTPSLSYVGQGMIMGTKTGVSAFIGAVIGWGILGPIAKAEGWAESDKNQSSALTGVKGWILWISLFIMLSESLVSLLVMVVRLILMKTGLIKNQGKYSDSNSTDPAPENQRVPNSWWIGGTIISVIVCVAIVSPLFGIKVYETLIAVVLSLLTSILAVRALGETDINPVSGIGKISQIIFAFVAPKNVLSNLVAGAIAEAGSQQAGDMMQDLKTGHLLKASPRIQFYGQLIGSFFSIFFAVVAYQLYSYAYEIPSPQMQAPTAGIWYNMAKLVNGGELAHNVLPFCIVFAILVSLIPIIEAVKPEYEHYLPSGIALAIGFFQTPNWSITRCIGSFVQYYWQKKNPHSYREYMIIVASGFVLGEGITSILTAILKVIGVPHL